MKKFVLGIFVGALLMVSTAVFAEDGLKKIEAYLRPDLAITLDGNKLVLENSPLIYDGNTYLPLRELATSIGLNVGWNDATQTAELKSKVSNAPSKSDNGEKVTKTTYKGIKAIDVNGIIYFNPGAYNPPTGSVLPWKVDLINKIMTIIATGEVVDLNNEENFKIYEYESYLNVKYYPKD